MWAWGALCILLLLIYYGVGVGGPVHPSFFCRPFDYSFWLCRGCHPCARAPCVPRPPAPASAARMLWSAACEQKHAAMLPMLPNRSSTGRAQMRMFYRNPGLQQCAHGSRGPPRAVLWVG